jgi:speckle-type POZ protein
MLRFVYTDDLPGYEGEGSGDLDEDKAETIQDLLAAADRYALDRLKLLCARKLWDGVSTDTIGATLACAETYNCSELRKKCIDYFADEKNFKKAVLTDGFVELVQKFPSILAELRVKVGA